jgi:hypothetical protein
VSAHDPKPTTATITDNGQPNPANPAGAPIAGMAPQTVACRKLEEQKRIEKLDGTYEMSSLTLRDVPAGTVFPEGCTVRVGTTDYGVLRTKEDLDHNGEVEGITVYLK